MDDEIRRLERAGPSLELLKAYKRAGRQAEALDVRALLGYTVEVSALVLPTELQTRRFVRYVAGAHSWYKHLRSTPTPFYFYLNPHANTYGPSRERPKKVEQTKWKKVIRYLPEKALDNDRELFHYSSFPTDRYRELFGHWSYSEGNRPVSIYSESGIKIRVPRDVAQVGLTRSVHYPLPGWKGSDSLELDELENYPGIEPTKAEHEAMLAAMLKHLEVISGQKQEN